MTSGPSRFEGVQSERRVQATRVFKKPYTLPSHRTGMTCVTIRRHRTLAQPDRIRCSCRDELKNDRPYSVVSGVLGNTYVTLPRVQYRLGKLELGGMDKRRVEGIADETRRRGDACPCFSSVTPARASAARSIHWTFDSPIPRRLSMPPTRRMNSNILGK